MAKKIRKLFRRLGENRTLLLGVVFLAMFAVLIGRLFILQVVHGEEYADNFELQITKTRTLDSTRGNIYDRNGKLIAGNKVSYSVTIEDNGTYNTTKERILSLNAELYRLCKLIRANGDSIDTSTFPIEVDENGAFVFTGEEGTTRDRFRTALAWMPILTMKNTHILPKILKSMVFHTRQTNPEMRSFLFPIRSVWKFW